MPLARPDIDASFASQIHDANDARDARDAAAIDNQLVNTLRDAT